MKGKSQVRFLGGGEVAITSLPDRDRRRSERTVEPLLETWNQGRVRSAQSAPQTDARLPNRGSFGLRHARLRHHFRPWKMTYHDLNVKMGESGRVRLKCQPFQHGYSAYSMRR